MDELQLNHVRRFVAVARAGTLTTAGKGLGLPASMMSRALTRLERHLGVLLVRRNPRVLVLTDLGEEYLHSSRRGLRTLRDGGESLEARRSRPSALIRVVCPVTMSREILAPLPKEFLERYPDLRIEIDPYAASWDQEPREDVDVFFNLRAPKDSARRTRPYPGAVPGLFASPEYIHPATPNELIPHTCIGSGVWKLNRGQKIAIPNILFGVVSAIRVLP